MSRQCNSHVNVAQYMERSMNRRDVMGSRELASVNGTEKIYIGVVYWVLYQNEEDNLSLELLQSQHQMTNVCFNALNPQLDKVPTQGRYNHAPSIGNANIVFLPTSYKDLSNIHIKRVMQTTGPFRGLSETVSWMLSNGHIPVEDKLNIICTNMPSILGEAEVEGNKCVITSGAVGGNILQGSITSFKLGITAVHEIGHNFSLPHVFTLGTTNLQDDIQDECIQAFADIPAQRYPNYDFQLFLQSDGITFDGALCNRQRDCKIYREGNNSFIISGSNPPTQPYSCFGCAGTAPICDECDTSLYEQGCNFLDYGTDDNLVMFSKLQCVAMRETLISGATGIRLLDSDGGELGLTDIDTTPSPTTTDTTTLIPDDSSSSVVVDSDDNSGLSMAAVVGIAVGSVVVAIMFFLLIWFLYR
jgi:hypothetical protein